MSYYFEQIPNTYFMHKADAVRWALRMGYTKSDIKKYLHEKEDIKHNDKQ